MGLCWHEKGERSQDDFYKNFCSKCGELARFYTYSSGTEGLLDEVRCLDNPDYCNSLEQSAKVIPQLQQKGLIRDVKVEIFVETAARRVIFQRPVAGKYEAKADSVSKATCLAALKTLEGK